MHPLRCPLWVIGGHHGGDRVAATTKSRAARGRNFGTLLRRNAARRWKKLRHSKASLDFQRSKTSACNCSFHPASPDAFCLRKQESSSLSSSQRGGNYLRPKTGRFTSGFAIRPSRSASLRAAFLPLRIASPFSRARLSDGFSKAFRRFNSRKRPSRWSFFFKTLRA